MAIIRIIIGLKLNSTRINIVVLELAKKPIGKSNRINKTIYQPISYIQY